MRRQAQAVCVLHRSLYQFSGGRGIEGLPAARFENGPSQHFTPVVALRHHEGECLLDAQAVDIDHEQRASHLPMRLEFWAALNCTSKAVAMISRMAGRESVEQLPRPIARHGYCLLRQVLESSVVDTLKLAVAANGVGDREGSRNTRGLERLPAIADLAATAAIRDLVEPVLGNAAFVVRGLLFDKVPEANWHVGWHQDLMIPVAARVDTPGFGPWSTKQGVTHVRPPAEVLAGMLTLRVHLDDCPLDNGPLEVLPGTHLLGVIDEASVRDVVAALEPVVCTATAGDVLVMRPLLLHASRRSQTAGHRRVVHLEFAAQPLPGGLEWWRG